MRRTLVCTLGSTLAAVMLVAACTDSPQSLQPVGPETRATPENLVGARGQEQLVREIPGYGGFFLDEDGVPNVYLMDSDEGIDAELEIAQFMRGHGMRPQSVKVRHGDFSIPQLDDWLQEAAKGVLQDEGVVSVDIDDRLNRVSVGVTDAGMVEATRTRLSGLGIPEGALDVVVYGPIERAATLQDFVRPVSAGLQINFDFFVCTLGFNVSAVNGRRAPSFVTNSHCTDVQGGTEDTRYFQPAFFVPDAFIGREVDDPAYDPINCFDGFVCRLSDAARVRYDGGVDFRVGSISRTTGPNNFNLDIVDSWKIVAKRDPIVGQVVNKVGRTTGWSRGPVLATGVITQQAGTNILIFDQAFAEGPVGPGDSGSPVFRTDESYAALQGLLWGSGGGGTFFVFSPISNIEAELGKLTVR